MAYFTRSRMVLMVLEMYDYLEHFRFGATADRGTDMKMLIGIQQKALVLGEYLESMGMDYSDVVTNIENACNLVYDMAENLDDEALVMQNYRKLVTFCLSLSDTIKNRIVEISNIDIYDFRHLSKDSDEAKVINKAIDDIYDEYETTNNESCAEEIYRPLVVGNY